MASPGRPEKVGVLAANTAGSTIVGFHENGSTTAQTSVTRTIAAATVTELLRAEL